MSGCIGYKQFWLPKTEDIRLRNCFDPPNRIDLTQMVVERMRTLERTGDATFDRAV